MRIHPYSRRRYRSKESSKIVEAEVQVPGKIDKRNATGHNSSSLYSENTNNVNSSHKAAFQGEEDNRFLWSALSLKNYSVTNWPQFINTLNDSRTLSLSTNYTVIPRDNDNHDQYWKNFTRALNKATTLIQLRVEKCPSSVVEELLVLCSNLEELRISDIKNNSSYKVNSNRRIANLTLMNLHKMSKLNILCLNGQSGLSIMPMQPLPSLKYLTHLSLLTVKSFPDNFSDALKTMPNNVLRSLELGDCDSLPNSFPGALAHFLLLESLRLTNWRKGREEFAINIFTVIRQLKKFRSLELENVDLINCKMGDLKKCTKITSMLIIPVLKHSMSLNDDMISLIKILRDMPNPMDHVMLGLKPRMLANLNETMKTTERPRRNQRDLRIETYTDMVEKSLAGPKLKNLRDRTTLNSPSYVSVQEIEMDTIFHLENWIQSMMRSSTRVELINIQSAYDTKSVCLPKKF